MLLLLPLLLIHDNGDTLAAMSSIKFRLVVLNHKIQRKRGSPGGGPCHDTILSVTSKPRNKVAAARVRKAALKSQKARRHTHSSTPTLTSLTTAPIFWRMLGTAADAVNLRLARLRASSLRPRLRPPIRPVPKVTRLRPTRLRANRQRRGQVSYGGCPSGRWHQPYHFDGSRFSQFVGEIGFSQDRGSLQECAVKTVLTIDIEYEDSPRQKTRRPTSPKSQTPDQSARFCLYRGLITCPLCCPRPATVASGSKEPASSASASETTSATNNSSAIYISPPMFFF